MSEESSDCRNCGATTWQSTVSYGSYSVRCEKCKSGVATSWCAVAPKWTGMVRVFREGEMKKAVLVGECSEIWQEISRLAADGTVLILQPIGDQPR